MDVVYLLRGDCIVNIPAPNTLHANDVCDWDECRDRVECIVLELAESGEVYIRLIDSPVTRLSEMVR